jgi:hypothetical protein
VDTIAVMLISFGLCLFTQTRECFAASVVARTSKIPFWCQLCVSGQKGSIPRHAINEKSAQLAELTQQSLLR